MRRIIAVILAFLAFSVLLSSCDMSGLGEDDLPLGESLENQESGESSAAISYDYTNGPLGIFEPEEKECYPLLDEYKVIVSRLYNYGPFSTGVIIESEINLGEEVVEDKNAPKTLTEAVFGNEYKMEYERTYDSVFANGLKRYYKIQKDEKPYVYAVYSESGEIISKKIEYDYSSVPKNVGRKLTPTEMCTLAIEVFKGLVEDPENFYGVQSGLAGSGNRDGSFNTHIFTWKRRIGGIDTMESVTVAVDEFGNVSEISIEHFGETEDMLAISEEGMKRIEESIAAKVAEIYKSLPEGCEVSGIKLNPGNTCLVRLKDGKAALKFQAMISISRQGSEKNADERLNGIIPLE